MKKYNESDIEKMLSNTEKTDASFDKNVVFPINVSTVKRRRFSSMLIAACMTVIIVSCGSIIALIQSDGNQIEYSDFEIESVGTLSSIFNDNSFDANSGSSGFVSFPYENSWFESSGEYSEGEETRNPFGNSEDSDESGGAVDTSEGEDHPSQIVFPNDKDFFENNGIGVLSPKEYFEANPYKQLKDQTSIIVYSRPEITDDEYKAFYNAVYQSPSFENNDVKDLYIDKYGDWKLKFDKKSPVIVSASSDIIKQHAVRKVDMFIKDNEALFGGSEFNYSISISDNLLEVFAFERVEDEILLNIPDFVFTFKEEKANKCFSMVSVEHRTNNMRPFDEYDIRSYSDALKDFFRQPITEDGSPESDAGRVDFELVGYDIRYLYSNEYAFLYPYYTFVVKFDPDGENQSYKLFFVPAIDDEFVTFEE